MLFTLNSCTSEMRKWDLDHFANLHITSFGLHSQRALVVVWFGIFLTKERACQGTLQNSLWAEQRWVIYYAASIQQSFYPRAFTLYWQKKLHSHVLVKSSENSPPRLGFRDQYMFCRVVVVLCVNWDYVHISVSFFISEHLILE